MYKLYYALQYTGWFDGDWQPRILYYLNEKVIVTDEAEVWCDYFYQTCDTIAYRCSNIFPRENYDKAIGER